MPYRTYPKDYFEKHHLTPVKAIRSFCLLCTGVQEAEVSRCPDKRCPLYPYRKGHRVESGKSTLISLGSFRNKIRKWKEEN